jgi:hypothetical protein
MRHLTSRRNLIRRAALAALLACAAVPLRATQRGPDAGGYVATDTTVFSFVDLAAAGGAGVLAGADDATADLTLPFAFQFYGVSYTRVCVSSNGALYFITTASACSGFTDFANTDLSGTAGPNDLPAVFPFWTDLAFQVGGSVVYQTVGAPGARRFVIEWNKAYPLGSASPVTFEVVLSEGTNRILLQYDTVDLGPGDPASKGGHATIGVRNHGAPANNQQLQWSYGVPVIADQTAVLVSNDADTVAPTIVSVTPSPGILWPPNHQMVPVTLAVNASDNVDPSPACAITSVSSNEPVSGLGDGDTAPDWQFNPKSLVVNLRSERAGKGSGRVYTMTVSCSDRSGNTSAKTATVTVPHDQGKK